MNTYHRARRHVFVLSLMLALCTTSAAVAGKTGPRKIVEGNYAKIQAIVQAATTQRQLRAKVTGVLDTLIDWNAFSRKTMTTKIWGALKPEDRARFIKAYRKLIVRKYAKRFKPKSAFSVEFRGKTTFIGKLNAVVKTTVHTRSGDKKLGVDVDYLFIKTAAGWRTGDIVTDGVSRARTYRPKFRSIYRKKGLDALIAAIERNANKR